MQATDRPGRTLERTGRLAVTVAVTDVNEPPMVARRRHGRFSTMRGRLRPDQGDALATTGDHGRFEIDASGALSFKEAPDYESSDLGSDKAYTVTVRATEEDGDTQTLERTGRLAVTVAVTDVNEPPVISGLETVADYPENSPTTTVVGRRYMATDPEGAGVTWSDLSGNDAGKFEFSNTGVLTFKVSPNFEQQPEYEVTLNAFDGGLTGSLTVTVTIADVNEPPMVARRSGTGAFSIVENSGTEVGAFEATDPEGGRHVVARDHRRPWPLRDRRGERRAQLQGSARLRKLRPRLRQGL